MMVEREREREKKRKGGREALPAEKVGVNQAQASVSSVMPSMGVYSVVALIVANASLSIILSQTGWLAHSQQTFKA